MKKLIVVLGLLFVFSGINFAQKIVLQGDGVTDDTKALQAWGAGKQVYYKGKALGNKLENGTFVFSWRVNFYRQNSTIRNNKFIWYYKGYDRTDWIHFGKTVKYIRNKVEDRGMEPVDSRPLSVKVQERYVELLLLKKYVYLDDLLTSEMKSAELKDKITSVDLELKIELMKLELIKQKEKNKLKKLVWLGGMM